MYVCFIRIRNIYIFAMKHKRKRKMAGKKKFEILIMHFLSSFKVFLKKKESKRNFSYSSCHFLIFLWFLHHHLKFNWLYEYSYWTFFGSFIVDFTWQGCFVVASRRQILKNLLKFELQTTFVKLRKINQKKAVQPSRALGV